MNAEAPPEETRIPFLTSPLLLRLQYVVVAVAMAAWAVLLVLGPVDWDLAWQMHLADRILEGDRLYVDVGATEQHPPLYTWLCAAVTLFARAMGTDPLRTFIAISAAASIACAVVANRIARGNPLLLAGFGAASLAVHGLASGSGEQIATALSLPYIAAAAAVIQGREQSTRSGLVTGFVAGFGMALKPHYALVWLLVELMVAAHHRTWRSVLRPASRAAVSVWIAYILATVFITPRYFHAALQAARYYGAFMAMSLEHVIQSSPYLFLLVAWLACILLQRWTDQRAIARLLLLAATAMWIGGVVQMKGWYHHWTPALGLTIAGCAAAWPARARVAGLLLVLALGTEQVISKAAQLRRHQVGQPTFLPATMQLVNTRAPGGPILVFSDGLAIGFPLVNFTGATWTLPESSLWMVAGLYADQADSGQPIRYREPHEWVPFEREVHDLIWRGIQRHPPKLTLISDPTGRTSIRRFVDTDPRVQAYLADWQTIGRIGPYHVLVPPSASATPPAIPERPSPAAR